VFLFIIWIWHCSAA